MNGIAATIGRDNTSKGRVPVAARSNMVTVVAIDVNGNATTKSYSVVVTRGGTNTLDRLTARSRKGDAPKRIRYLRRTLLWTAKLLG